LEQILSEQFAVTLPGGLTALCQRPEPAAQLRECPLQAAATENWMSRLLHRFTGRTLRQQHYKLDTTALLLAITHQRALKGHKPIPPSEIKRRCGERLSLELDLESTADPREITLSKQQFDTVANIIREEFDVMLDNLDSVTGKTSI
jgi:hypothetical protein